MKREGFIVKQFSERLRSLRIKKGFTQEELAEKSGVSYKNIQYLESKEPTCPSLITVHKLAKAFGINLSAFFKNLD